MFTFFVQNNSMEFKMMENIYMEEFIQVEIDANWEKCLEFYAFQ